jgi:hypothetical protein
MTSSLRLRSVVRHTFAAYTGQAPILLATALTLAGVVKLDRALPEGGVAIVAGLVNLLVLVLFIGFVVLVAADVRDGRTHRGAGELLRSAWSAVGRLLLVGVVAVLAIGFISSLGWGILIAMIIGAAFAAGANLATFAVGALMISTVVLVPELFMLTAWSVFVPVVVLERPGGLRALGRSRELVRGNGWRVLALMLILTLPLSLAYTLADGAPSHFGGGAALAAELALATLIAPIPVLTVTSLYFELRAAEPTPAVAGVSALGSA